MNELKRIDKFRVFLKKPFPYEYDLTSNFRYSAGFGIFVALFLIIFRPFGIDEEELTFFVYVELAGFGLITFIILFFNMLLLDHFFLKYKSETEWNVKYEIVFTGYFLLFISVINAIYKSYIYNHHLNFTDFLEFIYYTFLVGFIPLLLGQLVSYSRQLKKNLAEAQKLNKQFKPSETNNFQNKIDIPDETGKGKVCLKLQDLYFIKAASNYVEIYSKQNETFKPLLVRTSLKKVEEAFSNFNFLFKCHRAYIVNLEKVKEISGNSQGYLLLFDNSEYTVPVSRSFTKELQNKLKLSA